MRRLSPKAIAALATLIAAVLVLAGCTGSGTSGGDGTIEIKHALGTTVIDGTPQRIATVNWANQEVPLALGVVPVGMAKANFGDDDDDGILPWVKDKLDELGGPTPVLFDETDGIDFEAVADTRPDVILAAYSGLTQEDYDRLTEIAPTVAYPTTPWGTPWQETIEFNSKAMNKEEEGKALVASLQKQIDEGAAAHSQIKGKSVMFLTHVDPTDLSKISFYTTHDTRVKFFDDLGMAAPKSIQDASGDTDKFVLERSSEQVDALSDVQIIVTYSDGEVLPVLRSDPLLSQMPAVAKGAVVQLPSDKPLGTAANPTPLAIPWILDEYLNLLDEAAQKTP